MYYITSIVRSMCCNAPVKFTIDENGVIEISCTSCLKGLIKTQMPQFIVNKLIENAQVYE